MYDNPTPIRRFKNLDTVLTQVQDTQGNDHEDDDRLVTANPRGNNQLITENYRGENVLSDKLMIREKIDFTSIPKVHAKGSRNLMKLIGLQSTRENLMETVRTEN